MELQTIISISKNPERVYDDRAHIIHAIGLSRRIRKLLRIARLSIIASPMCVTLPREQDCVQIPFSITCDTRSIFRRFYILFAGDRHMRAGSRA